MARKLMHEALSELMNQCLEEEEQYVRTQTEPPQKKRNRWACYTKRESVDAFMDASVRFVQQHPECRLRVLLPEQMRFLCLLQHLVTEDTADVFRPEEDRKHTDSFEGVLTKDVNSQLVKDAHRSEWTVEGMSFSMQGELSERTFQAAEERKRLIANFQKELVESLETLLLDFGKRRGLSHEGQLKLIQAISTQMSQCGLANLDRSSQASKIFVSGQGLEQRTTYNVSVMDLGQPSECLKLSLLCMKTGFTSYHTEESLQLLNNGEESWPIACDPASSLYQYATILFRTHPAELLGDCEVTRCVVVDALDEVDIQPKMLDEGL